MKADYYLKMKGQNGRYWFTLCASNGQCIMVSETYQRAPWALVARLANDLAGAAKAVKVTNISSGEFPKDWAEMVEGVVYD